MPYIFISYSHQDRSYVDKLANALQAEDLEVWIDDRIDYGEAWPKMIQERLDGCAALIVIVSKHSSKSEWVQNEVTRAKRKKKPFFPILLGGDPWLAVENTQYVNARDGSLPPNKFYVRLSQILGRIQAPEKLERTTISPNSGRRSINIPMASSKRALKEDLIRIAGRRSVPTGKIVEQILTFAVNNPNVFPDEIERPRPKPGKHISAKVAPKVADGLSQWAKDLGRNRAAHCCFLLECAVDDPELLIKIFR